MHNDSHTDWDNFFDQLPVDSSVGEAQRESAKQRALQAFDEQCARRSQRLTLQVIGRTLMKYKVPHSIAAMLIVAAGFWLLPSFGTRALAVDVLIDNLMKAKTARYDTTVTVDGQMPMKMKGYYWEPSHMREESDGFTNISDWATGKQISLDPKSKRATVFNLKNMPKDLRNGTQGGNWFEGIRLMLQSAPKNPNAKSILLGTKQLDGRMVVGLRLEMPGMPMTVWADPETQLPVRIESTLSGPPRTEVVMTNFEFNLDLEKSLFSVDVPAGYTVSDVNVDVSPATEADLIASLRMCAEVSDGAFPTGFDPYSIGKYAATYVVKKNGNLKGGPTGEQLQEVTKMARGFQFVLALPKESDAHYAGAKAKQGDADRPILWFKPAGSDKYRVVYADLSVKESNEAPQVANAKKL